MSARKSLYVHVFTVVMAALALGWAATVAADNDDQKFLATGQMTSYRPGDDGDIEAGAALRYKDNRNGTITDQNTKLVWEKKSADGSIHDVDNTYTWEDAFAVYIAGLNTANFAGHNDWRLANAKELQSIVNYQNIDPAVSAAFNTGCAANCTVTTCSCTAASNYWSSTTSANDSTVAWVVNFNFGFVVARDKSHERHVRAVRGSLDDDSDDD